MNQRIKALLYCGLLVFFFVIVLFGRSLPSHACLAIPWTSTNVTTRIVWPQSQSKDIARNAELQVMYYLRHRSTSIQFEWYKGFRLREKGADTSLALSVHHSNPTRLDPPLFTTFIIKPKQHLKPNTTYELLSNIAEVPCGPRHRPCVGEYAVITTFTTGSQLPQKPFVEEVKLTAGPTKLVYEEGDCHLPRESDCCQPRFKFTDFMLTISKSAKRSVRYNVYRLREGKAPEVVLERYPGGERMEDFISATIRCEGESRDPLLLESKDHPKEARLMVRAVDAAGNEGPDSNIIVVPSLCAQPVGCGCSTRGASASQPMPLSWMWLLGLVSLLWVGWRRERKLLL